MRIFNVHAAKTQLSRLIDAAAAGEEIVIARHGRPVARLVAVDRVLEPRRPGTLKGLIRVHDDFDAPLPAELAEAFGSDE